MNIFYIFFFGEAYVESRGTNLSVEDLITQETYVQHG